MGGDYSRTFETEDFINLFRVSSLKVERKYYPDRPFRTGESHGLRKRVIYPVREDFLQEEGRREPAAYAAELYAGREKAELLYSDFRNPRVEYSGFWFVPSHISFWAQNAITSDNDEVVELEIATKNRMILWMNDELIEFFAPYDLHVLSEKTISIPLRKGKNTLVVYCDQLAERNVEFFFSIQNKSPFPVTCSVPNPVSADRIDNMMRVLDHVYPSRDNFDLANPKILLHVPEEDVLREKDCYFDGLIRSVENKTRDAYWSMETNLLTIPEQRFSPFGPIVDGSVIIGDVREYTPGVYDIFIRYGTAETRVSTKLTVELYPVDMDSLDSEDRDQRRQRGLQFIANHGEKTMGKALAQLETGRIEDSIGTLNALLYRIEERFDCSDFEMPMLIVYYSRLCSLPTKHVSVAEKIKRTILNYRYWIDEPGNDVIWYFSENHALMFHTAQYLAGRLFPDETFHCSGRSGVEQRAIGEQRLESWYDEFLQYGYSEWNSPTYMPIDLIGILALLLLDRESTVATKAERALNHTLEILVKHNVNGVVSSSYGRSYTKGLLGTRAMGTSFLLWVLTGEGFVNQHSRAEALFCIIDPADLELDKPQPVDPPSLLREQQGKLGVALTDFITEKYKVSSISDFCVYERGEQEHVNQIRIGGDPTVNFWVNHPGESIVHGESRPSFWAGNGTIPFQKQVNNLLVIHYEIGEKMVGFTHLYAPLFALDRYELQGNTFYAESDGAFLFAACSRDLELVTKGASAYREVRAEGRKTTWVVKCSDERECGSYELFKENLRGEHIVFGSASVRVDDFQEGQLEIPYERLVT